MEGQKSLRANCVLFFIVLMFLLILNAEISRAVTPADCKQERSTLVKACNALLHKEPPSPFCCQRLRVTHIECVCPVITPTLAALVGDVSKAVKIIQNCGRQVPRHYKCGSITTP